MTKNPSPILGRGLSAGPLVLTGIAGWVDAVGVLLLAGVFTANMSGNTVGLGLGQDRWGQALAIPIWVLGMTLCKVVLARGVPARRVFWAEAGLLAACASGGLGGLTMVAGLAFAMGLQNAAVTHFGALSVRTTHVSGTLATLADELASWLLGKGGRPLPYLGVWAAYAVGAALAAFLVPSWGARCLAVPAVVLVLVPAD